MNIHEHQAKQILKRYGAVVPNGIFALTVDELVEKAKILNTKKYVLKAQIHAGGRGRAGGVKILDTIEELAQAAKELMGKTLVTHQTGPKGKKVKRLQLTRIKENKDKTGTLFIPNRLTYYNLRKLFYKCFHLHVVRILISSQPFEM